MQPEYDIGSDPLSCAASTLTVRGAGRAVGHRVIPVLFAGGLSVLLLPCGTDVVAPPRLDRRADGGKGEPVCVRRQPDETALGRVFNIRRARRAQADRRRRLELLG